MSAPGPSRSPTAPAPSEAERPGFVAMDVMTVFLGAAALVAMLLAGVLRWGGASRFLDAGGGVEVLFLGCAALVVIAAGLVLERLRWERGAGLGVPFDERFRWIDAPADEDAHEAAVARRAPGWVRPLRPTAYALVGLAFGLWSLVTMDGVSLLVLGVYVAPRLVALVRRARGATTPRA